MENKDFDSALALLKKSASLQPHFKTYEYIGECLLAQHNFTEAIIYLAAATGIGKKQFKALFLLAKALIELKDIDGAREKLDQALAINPNYRAAQELLLEIAVRV